MNEPWGNPQERSYTFKGPGNSGAFDIFMLTPNTDSMTGFPAALGKPQLQTSLCWMSIMLPKILDVSVSDWEKHT